MDEKLLGKCGFYCGACPTYIKGGCRGCEEEHTSGDCFTRDCVKEKKLNFCGECKNFPCDTIMTKPHSTVLDISFVSQYEAHFRVEMEQRLRLQSEETIKVYKKRLAQAEKRIGELDRLFIKIYEDNAKGNLSDERFAMMSKTYEDEQAQLKVEIVNLQKEVEVQERQIENLEQFIQRVRRYTTLTELTPYALRELVKAVYVEAPDKSSGKRKQKVHIEYDLVGYIPVDELIKAEQA